MRPIRCFAVLAVVVLVTAACSSGQPSASDPSEQASPSPASTRATATNRPSSPPSKTSAAKPNAKEQARLNEQLIAAAWDNDLRRARALIARGADVNAKDNTVQSAYLISTSEGHLELLNLTLRHGADVDSKDSFNGTGLIRAADRGHADIAGRLVQADIKINHINNLGWTALHEAIILGDGSRRYVDTVRVLIAAGADPKLQSQRDQIAPLQHATSKGHSEIAQVLHAALEADKPPKRLADQRLLAAAERGDATAAALAIRAGADLEARDEQGHTPLLRAVTEDRLAVARLLVYLGANPQIADRQGVTALQHAERRGQLEMARILRNI
jgi:ankyrin repeat protein